ncbi:hypothetical protein MPLB_1120031 [Mesorhizobium sp. ORS 3324]|nr:hypothetical protein MPLB_1120031 [Mesorhizobium sp. ORS 3324]
MANQVNKPTNTSLSMKQLEAKERGLIGIVFGTKEHAPTNVAGVALILLTALLGATMFFPLAAGVAAGSMTTALLSAITFTIGLMFGRSEKS